MSTKLKIQVTKNILKQAAYCGHIKEKGKYMLSDDEEVNVGCNCPIAVAIRAIFPKAIVGADVILPFGDEEFAHCFSEILLPPEAQNFVRDFDDLMPVSRRKMLPFEFEVDVPDDVLLHAVQLDEVFK